MGHINVLAGAASTQPQLAHAVLTKSLQQEWTFLLHVVPQCGLELEVSLFSSFLPATMFGLECLQLNSIGLLFLCSLMVWGYVILCP